MPFFRRRRLPEVERRMTPRKEQFILRLLVLLMIPTGSFGQDSTDVRQFLPEGLGIANQMKYSYNREQKIRSLKIG